MSSIMPWMMARSSGVDPRKGEPMSLWRPERVTSAPTPSLPISPLTSGRRNTVPMDPVMVEAWATMRSPARAA
jgi:hypothetical protein